MSASGSGGNTPKKRKKYRTKAEYEKFKAETLAIPGQSYRGGIPMDSQSAAASIGSGAGIAPIGEQSILRQFQELRSKFEATLALLEEERPRSAQLRSELDVLAIRGLSCGELPSEEEEMCELDAHNTGDIHKDDVPSTSKGAAVQEANTAREVLTKKAVQKANTATTKSKKKTGQVANPVGPSTSRAAAQDATAAGSRARTRREEKSIPVITTFDFNMGELNKIEDTLGHDKYVINLLSRRVMNITVYTIEDHDKLRKFLAEEKINNYTHTPRACKPKLVVIGRLSNQFKEIQVRESLIGTGLNLNILGLTKIGGDRWLLKLSKDSDLAGLYKRKLLLQHRVRYERYDKNGPTQCFRCQRFGHVAVNCSMPLRCVKCAGSHEGRCAIPRKDLNTFGVPVTDPITGEESVQIGYTVRCANCNIDGHTAGDKSCPRKMAITAKMKASRLAKANKVESRFQTTSARRVPGMSYASVAGRNPMPRGLSANISISAPDSGAIHSNMRMLDTDCSRLFGRDFFACLDKVGGFADEYRRLQTDAEKKRALFGLMVSITLG